MRSFVAARRIRVCGNPETRAPENILAPSLSGSGIVGETILLDPGIWAGIPYPRVTWEWLVDGVPIIGADALRYAPGFGDIGREISARVTATNSAGSSAQLTETITVIDVTGRLYVVHEGEQVAYNGDPVFVVLGAPASIAYVFHGGEQVIHGGDSVFIDLSVPEGTEAVVSDGETVISGGAPVYVGSA